MTKIDDLYEYEKTGASKNILLDIACKKLVLEGVLRADAMPLVLKMKSHECVVSEGEVFLDGVDLDTALRRLIAKMPLLARPVDEVDPVSEQRAKWEMEAKAGSVQSLGYLYRDYVQRLGPVAGKAQFKQWQAEQGVVAGQKAKAMNGAVDDAGRIVDGKNPFTRLRSVTGQIDKMAEAEIAEYTRTHGFAATKKLADEAGVNLSGHPLQRRTA